MDGHTVVVVDGVCNLCNSLVRFVLRHDRRDVFRFAHLQTSPALAASLTGEGATVVVIRSGRLLTESDAVVAILADLGGVWRAIAWLRIVPRVVRDRVYRFVARRRYGWFGRQKECIVPDEASRQKFVQLQSHSLLPIIRNTTQRS